MFEHFEEEPEVREYFPQIPVAIPRLMDKKIKNARFWIEEDGYPHCEVYNGCMLQNGQMNLCYWGEEGMEDGSTPYVEIFDDHALVGAGVIMRIPIN